MEELEPKIPLLSRLGGMLLSPRSTLAYVKAHPDWLVPYLIMGNLALVPVISDFLTGLFRLQMIALFSSVMVLILILVFWGVRAGVIWLLGRICGGKAHFYPLLCVLGYADFPQFLHKLLTNGLAVTGWQVRIPSLATFIPLNPPSPSSLSFVLISSIEPFGLWALALMILGIALIFGFRAGKAIAIGILYWVLSHLFVYLVMRV